MFLSTITFISLQREEKGSCQWSDRLD